MKQFLLLFFLFALFSTFAEAKNIPDEFLVKYRGISGNVIGVKTLGLDSLAVKSFFIGRKDAVVIKEFSELGIMHVRLNQVDKAAFIKSKGSFIEYIEANRVLRILGNPDQSLPKIPESQWGLKAADALKAWVYTLGSPEIIVGVIDSGIDFNHYALKNQMWTNPEDGSHGWDFVTDDNNPIDTNSHGTHCAGVIAANSKEFMGIAPNVKLMALRFIDDSGSGSTDGAISAIYYGVKHGAKVLSNSWGGGGYQKSLYDAIAYANSNQVLFVAAAGNEYNNNDRKLSYPASYRLDNVISVGAMDKNYKKASFSNYGKKTVHVFAAGVDIYSTVPNQKGQYMSGTSMATPQVSGVAALILSIHPNYTPIQVKKLIVDKVEKVSTLKDYCISGGMVSASKVLK